MRPETLWARYTWATGACFRCDRTNLDVTAIGVIEGWGVKAAIQACRACVFRLDRLLWGLVRDRDRRVSPPSAAPRGGP